MLTDQTDELRFVNRTISRGVGLLHFGLDVKTADGHRRTDRINKHVLSAYRDKC